MQKGCPRSVWPAEVAPAESSPMFHHPGAPGVGSHCQLPKVESHRAPQPGRAAAARALPDDLAWGSLFNLIGPSWCPAAAPSGRVCLCASPTSSPPCTAHKGSGMSRGWHRAPGQRLGQGCGGTMHLRGNGSPPEFEPGFSSLPIPLCLLGFFHRRCSGIACGTRAAWCVPGTSRSCASRAL